jgi:hypothetical protein
VRLATPFLIYLQVLVLALTSPISAGQGPHRDQLLDPVFPHVHPDVRPPPLAGTYAGNARLGVPVLGTGATLESGVYGELLVPLASLSTVVRLPVQRLIPTSDRLPVARHEPPPDPPPLVAG